jgi:uncharacterized protein YjbI with pentapeptide repeats
LKVFKPSKLSVLTRCFEHQRRYYMGVSVLAFVPLAAAPALLPEAAMWTFAGKRLGKDGALDAGMPKTRAEYLIHGLAFAPGGVATPSVAVGARVGSLVKRLSVIGDRYWIAARHASDAQPFTELPLTWQNAFGGPEFAHNPVGKGQAEVEIQGAKVVPLPNVERPEGMVASTRDRPEPGGFGPIDISWPQRATLAGTYDQHWLDNLFPGLARDVDWGIFNIAPRDQQFAQPSWQGGETYEFMNVHPTQPRLVGELPRWTARCFVTRVIGKGEQKTERLEEVQLRLQTLWFFPDAERAILIHHGSLAIGTDDGSDVVQLLIGADRSEAPRSVEHYQAVIATRLDPETGSLAALDDAPLLPEGLADARDPAIVEAEALYTREGLIAANLHNKRTKEFEQARAFVAAHGLDPDEHGPSPPPPPPGPLPPPAQLPAYFAKLKEEAKQTETALLADQKARQAVVEKELDELRVPGLDSAALRKEQEGPVGPPTFSAAAQRAALEAVALECREQGFINDEVEGMLADRELQERWTLAELKLRGAYLLMAHNQPPAPRMPEADLLDARICLQRYVEAGRSVRELNLTGGDFREMDLRNADLSDGWFESACFDGADLRGAKLDSTVLAHASLIGAKLDGASARKANFGKANLTDASMAELDFGEAILASARFERTILRGAKLSKADLLSAEFVGADLCEITAEELVLNEAKLAGAKFAGAKLERSLFVKLDLDGVDFSGARLHRCAFVSCTARRANFSGASMGGVAFVEACVLDGAAFVQADMPRSNLRGMPLSRADFTAANLDGADLSNAVLIDAKFYRAVAREARFDRANLTGASMLAANLMQASFMSAIIEGVDLRGANLYAADMAKVRSDNRVRLDDALLTKVRILPKYHEQPEQ